MKTIRALLIPGLLLCCVQIWPGQARAVSCQGKTAIVYANGIFNSRTMARDALINGLQKRLIQFSVAYSDSAQYEYKLAYADNGGATGPGSLTGLAQLYEAFVQKQAANDSSFWRWLGDIVAAPSWFTTMMTDLATATNANAYIDDATLQLQLNGDPADPVLQPGYRTLLKEGKQVVIVAHSQGNFYANTAYDGLVQQSPDYANRLGIVAVATPDNRVAGSGPYITVPEDAVIAAVRQIYPATLPAKPVSLASPNMAELGSVAWANASDGHGFVQWYLAGTYTRNFIMDAIVQTLNKLQPPFANSDKTTFTGAQFPIYPSTFADASRCVLDDTHHLGFSVSSSQGYVSVAAYPLSGTTTSAPSYYNDYIPAVPYGLRQSIGILPIPSGVGIVYADVTSKGAYWFNSIADDLAVFGDTTVHLISYIWDPTTGNWTKQTSQLTLPQHTMSVRNFACPTLGPGSMYCSGPLVNAGAATIAAYYDPVVYKDGFYDYGGDLDLPGYQSKLVFGGYVNQDLQGSWLVVSLNGGQLSAGPIGVFSLSWDSVGNIFSDPLTVGVPGYIRLHRYEDMYLSSATSDNVGIVTQ